MDWCSAYLTPQALSKYIYLSPPLIFPTTSTELEQKTSRWITPGATPLRWMGPNRNPRWEQKRTESYVIVSTCIAVINDIYCFCSKSKLGLMIAVKLYSRLWKWVWSVLYCNLIEKSSFVIVNRKVSWSFVIVNRKVCRVWSS